MEQVYFGNWSDWSHIQHDFRMDDPEPEVIFAAYSQDYGYDGTALVIYRIGDTYYEATGSHCSCYGLEGQWVPEEYNSLQLLKDCWAKRDFSHSSGEFAVYNRTAQERIANL